MATQEIPPAEDCSVVITHAIADERWSPVYWEVRNSAMGELITSAILDHGEWRDLVTRDRVSIDDIPAPAEVLGVLRAQIVRPSR